ncbi:MAG TPA: Fic family protein [Porticoccaceae bacterium]|jgi:hypothetical protein|nr:Fic family protein [Porticoccaceae bacterium]
MAKSTQQQSVLMLLQQSPTALSLRDIELKINHEASARTLRRWLAGWVAEHKIEKTGAGPSTLYQIISQSDDSVAPVVQGDSFGFLRGLDADLRVGLLGQIRDLWTHSSTALEGNTLSLGDTHFILEQGLTVSGKPIKDHQEVRGHARAIELLYQCVEKPLSEELVFSLHRAVQTEPIDDIYKPMGGWKVEANGTHMIGRDNKQHFIEYALPLFVPRLMAEVLDFINSIGAEDISLANAAAIYAKVHMSVAHIHPFWDGNGRMARLLANIPLLKGGLPPLVIGQETRRVYIQTLSNYQVSIGQLTSSTGVWPAPDLLGAFSDFCASNYGSTQTLVDEAFAVQGRRSA